MPLILSRTLTYQYYLEVDGIMILLREIHIFVDILAINIFYLPFRIHLININYFVYVCG